MAWFEPRVSQRAGGLCLGVNRKGCGSGWELGGLWGGMVPGRARNKGARLSISARCPSSSGDLSSPTPLWFLSRVHGGFVGLSETLKECPILTAGAYITPSASTILSTLYIYLFTFIHEAGNIIIPDLLLRTLRHREGLGIA